MSRDFDALPRNQRRTLLAAEKKARWSGNWGLWEVLDLPAPPDWQQGGWLGEVRTVHRNRCWSVLDRALPDGTRHLAITSLSQIRPTWWEMQRIKDELAGHSATAVEIYPPSNEVVDGANMYHLWVVATPMPSLWRTPTAISQD